MTNPQKHERASAIRDDILYRLEEEDLTKDPSPLFDEQILFKLAQLNAKSKSLFIKLMEGWKKDGIARIPDLEVAVRQYVSGKRKWALKTHSPDDDGLVRNGLGEVVVNPATILAAIKGMGVRLSYDTFRNRPEIHGLEDHGPALDDNALRRLWLAVEAEHGFTANKLLFTDVVLDAAYQGHHHPVTDYLDDLVDYGVWDGKPRIDHWLSDYANAEDTPFVRAVGAIVLMAAVRRVRQPGVKFDEMLVLESAEQGYGKSSLVAALAVHPAWFTDSIPLAADDKVMMERTAGTWIAEIGELQGMRKGEIEKIRAQLSRTSDRARPAYGRLTEDHPRQFIMIGTTNATKASPYLADIAGNRRYWPVEVGRCDVAGLIRDRDQLWAEAAIREATGASIRLKESLWASAGVEQDARAIGNAFVDVLGPALGNREGIIRADHAWRILRIPVERRDAHAGKFGKAMKALGWERRQSRLDRGGDPLPCYRKGDSERVLVVDDDGREVSVSYQDERWPLEEESEEEAVDA